MNKSSFFIVGKHAVIEALKNPKRKVLKIFLTEESKKNIHRESQNKNLLKDIKGLILCQNPLFLLLVSMLCLKRLRIQKGKC